MLFSLALFSTVFAAASALNCHVCGGADGIPSFAKSIITELNLTSQVQLFGDCKAKTGDNACSNGLFCMKRAVIYEIGYKGISYKWNTYTKGCATTRADNNGVPTNTCYDLGVSSNTTGYKIHKLDCYCQKPDLCNGVGRVVASAAALFLSLLLIS